MFVVMFPYSVTGIIYVQNSTRLARFRRLRAERNYNFLYVRATDGTDLTACFVILAQKRVLVAFLLD